MSGLNVLPCVRCVHLLLSHLLFTPNREMQEQEKQVDLFNLKKAWTPSLSPEFQDMKSIETWVEVC